MYLFSNIVVVKIVRRMLYILRNNKWHKWDNFVYQQFVCIEWKQTYDVYLQTVDVIAELVSVLAVIIMN